MADLKEWQERLSASDKYWKQELTSMDEREGLYNGDHSIKGVTKGDKDADAKHVHNIIFENIESQVSTYIPSPKVTARKKEDEHLAEMIETFLRNELDRMPFEKINDMAERTVPIQGGVGYLVEWDNTQRTHDTIGEIDVSVMHPKQFGPQPGVFTGIERMDWFIAKVPTTKSEIKRRYDKDITDEGESEPEIRSSESNDRSDDAVTLYIGYEKGENGINKFSWVNDVELENLEDYQTRRVPRCASCGRIKPLVGQVIYSTTPAEGSETPDNTAQIESDLAAMGIAGDLADRAMTEEETPYFLPEMATEPEENTYDGGACPFCGGTEFTDSTEEYEEIYFPMTTESGLEIPGPEAGFNENGEAVFKTQKIPFYKPNVMPVVLQRSVSVYGKLLGQSDVDVITDQQNTTKRMDKKIIDRLVKAGTRIAMPDRPELRNSPEDAERWFVGNPADLQMIRELNFDGNISQLMAYRKEVYEESRQMLGITDSFQGRRDPTATSGVARQMAAAQSAGRLESKRTMKNAAYADLFKMMFQFFLAYADEPRPINRKNSNGDTVYENISRYAFLKQDSDGQFYWEDQFLFSCDNSTALAGNREAMWQETRMNLQTGAFGDPSKTETLILFWTKMEELHYPGAASTRKHLEERMAREQEAMRMQQMQQMQAAQAAQGMPQGVPQGEMVSPAAGGLV